MALSVAAAIFLLSAMSAGHWLADPLLLEGIVAGVAVLAFAPTAWAPRRALRCAAATRHRCRCT